MFKRTLFIRTKHNMPIFGVSSLRMVVTVSSLRTVVTVTSLRIVVSVQS